MIDLVYAFRLVVLALEDVSARYLVVGSTAAGAWGVARSTRDVDIVAVISSDSVEAFLSALEGNDLYVPAEEARLAAEVGGSFNILHTATGGKVDLFVCSPDNKFESIRLDRRVQLNILGVLTWVATPEDVVLSKLRWRLESRSETQWRDCIEIAAAQNLDTDYMRLWAQQIGITSDLEELLAATKN